jgi:hypothetical protein
VGFVHPFCALTPDEVRFILEEKWGQLGLILEPDDFADTETVAAIIRITGGNFRLLHRLLTQIERVLQINDLHLVTEEVVDAAREGLVIGIVSEPHTPGRLSRTNPLNGWRISELRRIRPLV